MDQNRIDTKDVAETKKMKTAANIREKNNTMKKTLLVSLSCVILTLASCSSGTEADKSSSDNSDMISASESADEIVNVDTEPFEAEGMKFSAKSGFYDSGFELSISADDGAEIYYTLDGSIPTDKSIHYESPFIIKDRSSEKNKLSSHTDIAQPIECSDDFVPKAEIDKATIVRAMTIDKNGRQSAVVSNTYFVGFDKKADFYKNRKIVSLITDEENLFDYEKGIYVTGKVYDDWKNSKEYDTEVPEWELPGNYRQKGREWEREATLQFFENGELASAQDVGIRIHGGATRSYSQKSINVYARNDYGAPKLEYDLFSENVKRKSDGAAITKFDTFTLRNGGNDAYYTRFSDKLIQSLVADREFLTQGMEPCIVFIDGEFWGHYEITEKLDEKFVGNHYDIPSKEICIIKAETLNEGTEGTYAEWEKLRKWINETDFSEQSAYEELCEYVDMQGFMDYISTEIYINNADWGRPNSAMWKAENTDNESPYADGKWRFILYDTEYSSGLYGQAQPDEDSFEKFMQSDCFLADMFNGALENEGFRKQFSDTFMEIADKNFGKERVEAEIDRLSDEYHDMVIATYDRFWSGWTGGVEADANYELAVSSLKSFYSRRYACITEYLEENMK